MKEQGLARYIRQILGVLLVLAVVTGCDLGSIERLPSDSAEITVESPEPEGQPTPDSGVPYVEISSPVAGQQFGQGQDVQVLSGSIDAQGIVRVELLVDNQIVHTDEIIPQPNAVFAARQVWLPDRPGSHTLQVRAYNPANVVGQSEQVIVQVLAGIQAVTSEPPTPTPLPPLEQPTPLPTSTPPPLPVPPTVTPTPSPALLTVIPTSSPAMPMATPTPDYPYLVVTGRRGLNVREGPSTRYGIIGLLLPGDKVEIRGQNDIGAGRWWQIRYSQGANGVGWVSSSADYSAAFNTSNVAVVPAPPTPVPPTPTHTPTSVPAVDQAGIDFGVDRAQIQGGECVTFYWNVTNVKEVYYNGRGVSGDSQVRTECPPSTEYFELRIVKLDGTVESKTIKIEVEGSSYKDTNMDPGESIDFDRDGKVSRDGDDFKWAKVSGERRFRKWDDDDDLELVPVGPVDNLDIVRRQDCEWALDHLDDTDSIRPHDGLAACFRTDESRIGKLRFEDVDDDELEFKWLLWGH